MTLVSLLIGTALSATVLSGIASAYLLTLQATTENIRAARLNQELRAVLELMQRDIRRAGYWARPVGADPADNPFVAQYAGIDNDLQAGAASGEAPGSCLTYSYDLNDNGLIGVCDACSGLVAPLDADPFDRSNVEMMGFRLRAGAVQMRVRRANQADQSFDCVSGAWEAITSADVRITALAFRITRHQVLATANSFGTPRQAEGAPPERPDHLGAASAASADQTGVQPFETLDHIAGDPGQTGAQPDAEPFDPQDQAEPLLMRERRLVEIQLSGRSAHDQTLVQTLSASVSVHNDRLFAPLAPGGP